MHKIFWDNCNSCSVLTAKSCHYIIIIIIIILHTKGNRGKIRQWAVVWSCTYQSCV